jgi:hypothetical protein
VKLLRLAIKGEFTLITKITMDRGGVSYSSCSFFYGNTSLHVRRLLNEIIVDFDEILDDEKFSSVEKIKTIGTQH